MNKFQIWMAQIRAKFLLLPIMLVTIATGAAWSAGLFNLKKCILLLIGNLLAHASVNLFNEYSDHKTGIDWNTKRTPFSGGTGCIQAGNTSPKSVLRMAIITLLAAFFTGVYLCMTSGWFIMIFMVIGAFSCVFYTPFLAGLMLGEFFTGLSLGTLVVLGSYYVYAGALPLGIILISIPPGILTALLLFLNEFPDREADIKGGRRQLVVVFGKKICSRLYASGIALTYISIIVPVVMKTVPVTVLIGLLTMPIGIKASLITLKHYDNTEKLIPAMGMNVVTVLITDLLIAIGFFI